MVSVRQKIWDEGFVKYGETVATRFKEGAFKLQTLRDSADERLHLVNVYYSLVRTGRLLKIEHLPLAEKTQLWQETLSYCKKLTVMEDRKNFCRGLYALRAIAEDKLTRQQKKKSDCPHIATEKRKNILSFTAAYSLQGTIRPELPNPNPTHFKK